jgi:hypothetical protein
MAFGEKINKRSISLVRGGEELIEKKKDKHLIQKTPRIKKKRITKVFI